MSVCVPLNILFNAKITNLIYHIISDWFFLTRIKNKLKKVDYKKALAYRDKLKNIKKKRQSMELDYYLWKNKISHKKFAKQIEITPPTLSIIVTKKRSPLLMNAVKIHCLTKGSVSLFNLLTLEDQEKLNEQYPLVTKTSAYKYDTQVSLDYYLWKNKISRKSFALKVDIASNTVNDIVNKKRSPTLFTAMKIHCETAGTVSLYELLCLKDREEIDKKYGRIKKEHIYSLNRQHDIEKSKYKFGLENEDE